MLLQKKVDVYEETLRSHITKFWEDKHIVSIMINLTAIYFPGAMVRLMIQDSDTGENSDIYTTVVSSEYSSGTTNITLTNPVESTTNTTGSIARRYLI